MSLFSSVLISFFSVMLSAIPASAIANELVASWSAVGNFNEFFHFESNAVALVAAERERLHKLARRADYLSARGVSCEVVKISFGAETNVNPKALYGSRKRLALLRLNYLRQLASKLQFPKEFVATFDHDRETKISGVVQTEDPDTIGMVATFLPGEKPQDGTRPNFCAERRP